MKLEQIYSLLQQVEDQESYSHIRYIAAQLRNGFIDEMAAGLMIMKIKQEWGF